MKTVRWRGLSGYWPETKNEWITIGVILGLESIVLVWIIVYFVLK